MASIWFGVPRDVPVTALLEACGEHHIVERVVVERHSPVGRKVRWLMPFGAEGAQPGALLAALTRAAGTLMVVVDGTDECWRVLSLSFERGWMAETLDCSDQDVQPDEVGAPALRRYLGEHTTAADARAIDAPIQGWEHHVRTGPGDDSFHMTEPTEPDLPLALDWAELYDWQPSEDGSADNTTVDHLSRSGVGDYAGALACVDAELAGLGATEGDPRRSLGLFNRACYLSRLGRLEEALGSLIEAVRTGPEHYQDALEDNDLEMLRDDPRFAAAVREALERSGARELAAALDQRLFLPVYELDVTVRVARSLEELGIELIGDLVQKSRADLAQHAGLQATNEIEQVLSELGLTLQMRVENWAAAKAWWRSQRPDRLDD